MIVIEFLFVLNLVLLAADHIFTGVLAMFFPKRAVKTYVKLFGAEIPETKEYLVILKPWGALGIFATCTELGQRLGDIKPVALHPCQQWSTKFQGKFAQALLV